MKPIVIARRCKHTHTSSYQPIKSCKVSTCRFVCARCRFCCVCDTTRPRVLPLRPLIPPVEMKCNGADSIRAPPPRKMWRIKSRQIPRSLPSIHCCLVVGRGIKQWLLIHLALCTLILTQQGQSVIQQTSRANKAA